MMFVDVYIYIKRKEILLTFTAITGFWEDNIFMPLLETR